MSTASDARFWDRTSRAYARGAVADQAGYERTLDRTRALLGPGDRVLELGCGTGTTALRLAGDVQSYLATDISAGMIAIAEEKRAAAPVPALAFRTATAEALAPEVGPFDAVLGFNYLHLVRDLPGTLRRIHALLAAEGLFISKIQDTLRRRYEPARPACAARDARDRKGSLCRNFPGGGAEPADRGRRLRHSCHRKPRHQGQ